MIEVSSVSVERAGGAQGALRTIRSVPYCIHAFENFSEDKVQLRIGLFGQLAVRCDVIDLLLQAIRQGGVVSRSESAGVDLPKRHLYRAAHRVHSAPQRCVRRPLLAVIER